jgi:5-methylcytosine-specific restriction endonuclease McrA
MSSTLLLNADAQPVSIMPLSTISWQDAIRYIVLEKVTVVEWYATWKVRSEKWTTNVPAVVMLRAYHRPKSKVRISKRNIFLRDRYTCQYCGVVVDDTSATLDHVHPQSLGGTSTWTNLTTACKPCNYKKADNPRIIPQSVPGEPKYWELLEKRKNRGFQLEHASWGDYLQPSTETVT